MRVDKLIDTYFPTNGTWTGLNLGGVVVVWLTFIFSERDHRRYRVEPWVAEHKQTLRRYGHLPVLSAWLLLDSGGKEHKL
jgi:membrane protein YqaA with SNARE-associated domain